MLKTMEHLWHLFLRAISIEILIVVFCLGSFAGTWYIVNSSNGSYTIHQFGAGGDQPTQSAFGG
jgi:hypothetical protein